MINERRRSELWKTGLSILTSVAGAVAAYLALVQATRVPAPAPNKDPLLLGAVGAAPGNTPDSKSAIALLGSTELAGQGWILSMAGSNTQISDRQSATATASLQPAAKGDLVAGTFVQAIEPGQLVCLTLLANAFEISGPERACTYFQPLQPAAGRSWAWSLLPKKSISGPQTVAVSLAIYPQLVPADLSTSLIQVTRYISVDVNTNPLNSTIERYNVLVAALVTGSLTLLGIVMKKVLDRRYPSPA